MAWSLKILILAGGQGSRLFPLSLKEKPKQFVKLLGKSLFQRTLERHKDFTIYVCLEDNYLPIALKQARDIGIDVNFIKEPKAKNTFPAIVWALYKMKKEWKVDQDKIIAVTPADHYIEPIDLYLKDLKLAYNIARRGYIVTFGIKPSRPDSGFGYIKLGKQKESKYIFQVESFVEKPTPEKAEEFVKSGKYMWNSGIFVFSLNTFEDECKKYKPLAYELLNAKDDEMAVELFNKLEEEPVDKAIMEKSIKIVCLPFHAKWSDVGTFRGLYEVLCDDSRCVVLEGDILEIDSKDILVLSEDKSVIVVGLKNVAIINTKDYLLVLDMEHSQKVKDIVKILKVRRK